MTTPPDEPQWYKDAIIYELHIRAFKDSNGDGIGDLEGLIEKLDYLCDLGVTALWLLPFYPSPLRDGGYDIADYTSIHEHYGTPQDFARLLDEAHRRGLRIITELVLNHTSSEHPWFQRARRAPVGSIHRDFYVWSDTPKRYEDTRIIFQDFESSNWSWDPVANAYYWHRFYGHQPDLNFDNPEVQRALFEVIDYWMELGVDGMRLDAVPYLYEREGTSCENLPETHAFLKRLRAHVDSKYPNRMLLAEANQWPADAAAYFGDGDECHMNFHFPLMPRMFMALEQEDTFPIINILERTPQIHDTCQWAIFLRNHDELTLEMVTDEDRDTMYRAYAAERHARVNLGIRRRLNPLLGVRRKVELMKALLLSLPGTPVLYYGDEIGMGDNIYLGDRDSVRTPMQWSGDRNGGFSRANPQKVYLPTITDPEFHYEAINVEAQQANPSSLLWWTKRLIAKRKEFRVFGRGTIEFIRSENPRVLAFVRAFEDARVLVVANLSRFVQCTRLDLAAFKESVPVELFGRMRFPEITEAPYFVSLGPHGFYWLSLERRPVPAVSASERPVLGCRRSWDALLATNRRAELARVLEADAQGRRWFRGKTRVVKHRSIIDVVRIDELSAIVLLEIEYELGANEIYVVPIAFVADTPGAVETPSKMVIATVHVSDAPGHGEVPVTGKLVDAACADHFGGKLLAAMSAQSGFAGEHGRIGGIALQSLQNLEPETNLSQRALSAEQSNSAILFGSRFMMKILRVQSEGPSSEYEIGRFLNDRADGYRGASRLAGALEYRAPGREPSTLATLFDFIPNHGDGWQLTLDSLDRYYDRLLSDESRPEPPGSPTDPLVARASAAPSPQVIDWMGRFIDHARLLGLRTAELHRVLADDRGDRLFMPTPFDLMYQQSLYQSASDALARTCDRVRERLATLPDEARASADLLLAHEGTTERELAKIAKRPIDVMRIRVHGDFHLGQTLWTGDDFVIVDFEGEPARPLSQRRFKRCVLRDVAGMLRSFHYASEAARRAGRLRAEDATLVEPWSRAWAEWASASYLGGYLDAMAGSPLLPETTAEVSTLIDFYLLEKCIYEIGYELDSRPDWVVIPLQDLLGLIGVLA